MKISAFTQIIVTVAVTAWVFILPVMAVATILVLELALLLSIKHDRMTMAAIGGLAVFTGLMVLLQLLFGSSIEPYVYLLQPIILSTILTAFLWFFGDLLITLRNFKANFIGNIVALVSVLAVTFPFVNLWDMNGVSFAGAVACLAGVLTLLGFLIATVRRGPARAHGGNGERTDG